MRGSWIAVQVNAPRVFQQFAEQRQSLGHIREIGKHSCFGDELPQSTHRFTGGMVFVVVAEAIHSLLRFFALLPHIDKDGLLRRGAVVGIDFPGAKEDVVVGFAVPRRVEVNQIG